MLFPRLVYRSASVHVLAEDQAGYDALIADGWYGSVPEALGSQVAPAVVADAIPVVPLAPIPDSDIDYENDDRPPTRAEMEAKARQLGLRIDARWGDARLLREIEARL